MSCHGFFHVGQRIWKSSDHRLHQRRKEGYVRRCCIKRWDLIPPVQTPDSLNRYLRDACTPVSPAAGDWIKKI
jgi:hypothetical protein